MSVFQPVHLLSLSLWKCECRSDPLAVWIGCFSTVGRCEAKEADS